MLRRFLHEYCLNLTAPSTGEALTCRLLGRAKSNVPANVKDNNHGEFPNFRKLQEKKSWRHDLTPLHLVDILSQIFRSQICKIKGIQPRSRVLFTVSGYLTRFLFWTNLRILVPCLMSRLRVIRCPMCSLNQKITPGPQTTGDQNRNKWPSTVDLGHEARNKCVNDPKHEKKRMRKTKTHHFWICPLK